MMTEVEHLILIVGSNPFPNYLVAECFKPKRLSFIYTEQTKDYRDALINVLKRKDWAKDANIGEFENDICLENAKNPSKIWNDLENKKELFHEGVYLNYTGGTKAMAAQILRYFYSRNDNMPDHASYLDDESGMICFDSQEPSKELEKEDIKISLKDIFELHGLKPPKNSYWKKLENVIDNSEAIDSKDKIIDVNDTEIEKDTKQNLLNFGFKLINKKKFDWKNYELDWLDDLAKKLLSESKVRDYLILNTLKLIDPCGYKKQLENKSKEPNLPEIQKIYETIKDDISEKDERPKSLKFHNLNEQLRDLEEKYPVEIQLTDKTKKFWINFFTGTWFEIWLERLIVNNILNNKFTEIHQSVYCYKKDESNNFAEIDLCFLVGHRFYALSLTTSTDKDICKGKLFEISVRARQLAGDHARTALICLIDKDINVEEGEDEYKTLNNLKNNMISGFSPNQANQPKVFGLKDVLEWAGLDSDGNDQEPNYDSLKEFFEK